LKTLFDENLYQGEDSAAWIKYVTTRGVRVCHLKQPLTVIRTHEGSSRENINEIEKIITRNSHTVENYFHGLEKLSLQIRQKAIAFLFILWRVSGRPKFIRENKQLKKIFWKMRGF